MASMSAVQLPTRRHLLRLTAGLAACWFLPVQGQRRAGGVDEQILREAEKVASGARVDLYQHGVVVDPALAGLAEQALVRMEALLGRPLDEATLGPRVRVVVSSMTVVSHVWRMYEHPRDPRAIVFLNPLVAQLALRGTNATYAHELAHLLTWRYYSHTLREGLADYLALQLHPGAGVGPNREGYGSPPPVSGEVLGYLGTTRPPPDALMTDAAFRRAYYFASHRFVHYLIRRGGMATFLRLYDAPEPNAQVLPLYGATLADLVAASEG